jgi:hypothetical protein
MNSRLIRRLIAAPKHNLLTVLVMLALLAAVATQIAVPNGSVFAVPVTGEEPPVATEAVKSPEANPILFKDGRVNNRASDANQNAGIYCNGNQVVVYLVNAQGSILALHVTAAEILAVPEFPESNTLIKSANGVSLFRLTTGQLQVNAPGYSFQWKGCVVK